MTTENDLDAAMDRAIAKDDALDKIRARQLAMIEQRERFQRFWDSIIAPQISDKSERERMELMHKAWGMWRGGKLTT